MKALEIWLKQKDTLLLWNLNWKIGIGLEQRLLWSDLSLQTHALKNNSFEIFYWDPLNCCACMANVTWYVIDWNCIHCGENHYLVEIVVENLMDQILDLNLQMAVLHEVKQLWLYKGKHGQKHCSIEIVMMCIDFHFVVVKLDYI